MKGKTGKRLMSWLLAIVMLLGAAIVPVSASAKENAFVQERDGIPWDKVLKFVKKLGGSIVEEIPGGLFDWGMDLFLNYIFGLDDNEMSEEEREYFNQILQELDEVKEAVNRVQSTLNDSALVDRLNAFKDLDHQTPIDVFNALDRVEQMEGTPDLKAAARKSCLTDTIGIGTPDKWAAVNNTYDTYVLTLANALLTTYHMALNGQINDYYLLQVHEEYLRRVYHWEHQALAEWYAFQSNTVGLLVQALTIEKLSLAVRIDLISDYNNMDPDKRPPDWHHLDDGGIRSRLDYIVKCIGQVKKLYGDDSKLYANPHDTTKERYYWFSNGTEYRSMLFDAQVTNQPLPQEDRWDIGVNDMDKLKGIGWTNGWHVATMAKWDFWKPYFKTVQLLTSDQAKLIYEDYKSSKSLYDIFIGEDEGNFQGLEATNVSQWKLIIDTDDKHPVDTHWNPFSSPDVHVYAYFPDASRTGEWQDVQSDIALYSKATNEIGPGVYPGTAWFGVNLKQASGIPADSMPAASDEVHLRVTADGPEGWTDAMGDMEIQIDKAHGSPESVTVDGKTLNKKYYTIAKRSVTISTAYLSTLSKGLHTFVIYASKGTMTYVLRIGKQAMLKLPASLKKIDSKAFTGIAAENVMIPETCKEIGEGAFKGCANLRIVYLPDDVKIGKGAFSGCPQVTFICSDGSAAAKYADQNGIPHHN